MKKIENVTPIVATYGRWNDVDELVQQLLTIFIEKPIVVQDGGPSPSKDVKERLDTRSIFFSLDKNIGNARAISYGVKKVKTDFFLIIDSDDKLSLINTDKIINNFDSSNDIIYIPSEIDTKGKIRHREETRTLSINDLRFNKLGTHSGVIMSRSAYGKIGEYSKDMVSCKDWEYWIRACKNNFSFEYYPCVLHYAQSEDGISRSLSKVYNGRKQLWNMHRDIFPIYRRPIDYYILIKYAVGNCSSTKENAWLGYEFAIFSILHSALRWVFEKISSSMKHS